MEQYERERNVLKTTSLMCSLNKDYYRYYNEFLKKNF